MPFINSRPEVLQHSVIKLFKIDSHQTQLGDYRSCFSGEVDEFQSSDHHTQAALHASSLLGEVFLNPPCRSSLQNNTAFLGKPWSPHQCHSLGGPGTFGSFLGESKKATAIHKQPQRALEQPRVFWGVAPPSAARGCREKLLTLETLLMAGALLGWKLSHVASGGNQNNLATCVHTWGMCSKSMWCQVQFTTRIGTDFSSQPLS